MPRRPLRFTVATRRLWGVIAVIVVVASGFALSGGPVPSKTHPPAAAASRGAPTSGTLRTLSALGIPRTQPRLSAFTSESAGQVTRTIFPGFNTSLSGSFNSSIAAWLVGTPAYVPAADSILFPQRAQAVPGDPVPTIAPTAVFNLSSGSFEGLMTNITNASSLVYDPGNGDVYAALTGQDSVTVVNPRTDAIVVPSIPVGISPLGLALDPNSNQLFVANSGSSNVTVIDTVSNRVTIKSVPVGSNPVNLVADSKDNLVFVANAGSKFLTVLNTTHPATLSVNISLFDGPAWGLSFSPESDMVMATIPSSQYATIIDASAETPLDALLPVGRGMLPSVVSANGTEFLLGNASGGDILVLNSSTGTQIGSTLSVQHNATELIVDPETGLAYCWTSRNRVLETVNLSNGIVVPAAPSVSPHPVSESFFGITNRVYVAASNESLVYSMGSTDLRQVSAVISSSATPLSIAADPAASRFFLGTSNGLAIYNTSTDQLTSFVAGLSGNCSELVLDRADGFLWLSNAIRGVVAVSLTTLRVNSTGIVLPISAAEGIAVDPRDSETFVLVSGGSVTVLDSHTGSIIDPGIAVGANVTSLVFDPADDQLYSAGDQVVMVDGTTLAVDGVVAPFGTDHRVLSEAYDSSREAVYLTSMGELAGQQGVVTAIDGSSVTASGLLAVEVPVGEDPVTLGLVPASAGSTPGLAMLWVANELSGTISVISTVPQVTSFSATPSTIDLGSPAAVALTYVGGAGAVTVAYSGLPPGCASLSQLRWNCTPTSVGTFGIVASVTDALGATAYAMISLSVLPALAIRTTLGPATLPMIDVGDLLTGAASASNGLPPYTFGWTFGDGDFASGATTTHSYTSAGSFVLTVLVRDATGASANVSSAVLVVPRPTVGIALTPGNVTDVDFPLSLSTSIHGGTGAAQGTWRFDDGTVAYGQTATHAWTQAGTYAVTFQYTDTSGAMANATVNVTVHPTVTAEFSSGNVSSASPALPATPVLFRSTISGGTSPYSVTWSFGDGSLGFGLDVNHSYASTGTYVVGVELTDAVGATVWTNLTIAVASGPSSEGGIASVGGGFAAGLFLGLILGGVLAAIVLFVVRPRKGERPPPTTGSPYVPP